MSSDNYSGSDTRQKIISAAVRQFAQQGFHGATISDIARDAGISEGAIYRHFESKKQLLHRCLQPAFDLIAQMTPDEMPGSAEISGLVRGALEKRMRMFNDNYHLFKILFGEMPYSAELSELYLRSLQQELREADQFYQQLYHDGDIKRPPPRNWLLVALGQVMALWGMNNMLQLLEDGQLSPAEPPLEADSEHLVEDLTEYMLYGLVGIPPRESARSESESTRREEENECPDLSSRQMN